MARQLLYIYIENDTMRVISLVTSTVNGKNEAGLVSQIFRTPPSSFKRINNSPSLDELFLRACDTTSAEVLYE